MTVLHRAHLQTRLQTLFASIDKSSSDPFFYTKHFEDEKFLSLVTIFENGIDPDPAFSGSIMARIYLDEAKNLTLATWPISKDKNRPWRKEVLFPKVKIFEFEFLGKKIASQHGTSEHMRSITPDLAWRSHWPKTERQLPGLIRLKIIQDGSEEPLRYAFILPSIEPFVTYREGRAAI